jgi:hypothetical protein
MAKTRASLNREQALACVPVRSGHVREERTTDGVLRLAYPIGARPWVAWVSRRLGAAEPRVRTKQLELDEMGTAVWELVDGRRTVRGVIRRFARRYDLHPREAEVSVTLFLRNLGRRGIIGLQ